MINKEVHFITGYSVTPDGKVLDKKGDEFPEYDPAQSVRRGGYKARNHAVMAFNRNNGTITVFRNQTDFALVAETDKRSISWYLKKLEVVEYNEWVFTFVTNGSKDALKRICEFIGKTISEDMVVQA